MMRVGAELFCWAALLACGVAVYLGGSTYAVGVAFAVCSWIALTQSWSVFSSTTGYVSLGHVVFYGLGAYVTVLLFDSAPMPLALLASGAAALAFAAFVGLPVLRVRGPYFVILSFGLAELVKNLVILNENRIGQFSRMMFGAPDLIDLYAIMLGLAVLATLLAWAVRHARFGAGLLAIREDETAAETLGVPVTRLKLAAFVLSAAIPGVGGGIAALRTSYFEPSTFFDPTVSFSIVTMAIVGGGDDARGPVIGSLAFVLLSEMLWVRLPAFYYIVLGAMLIGFVLFLPGGLSSLLPAPRRRAHP
jgi:branched-chain amino acid transport system permease protein